MNSASKDSSPSNQRSRFLANVRLVSAFTFLSRILGLLRDIGMATLFGNGAILDAFTVAFRIPNMARGLFGEGALTAAFLPAFIREQNSNGEQSAWELAHAMLLFLTGLLFVLISLAEVVLFLLSQYWIETPEAGLLIGLTATMFPYLLLICLAAQVNAILHSFSHFFWPALTPVLLNTVWLLALIFVIPQFESAQTQVYIAAIAVLIGGVLQFIAPLPTLIKLGYQTRKVTRESFSKVLRIFRGMLPILLGLSITQLNTMCDSFIAWAFAHIDFSQSSAVLASMKVPEGTASALYFGQRMYQFPLGVFGVALGTVIFPALSRHAENKDWNYVREDLAFGLRLVISIAIPASVGLVILAQPITQVLFQHGAFDENDMLQTSTMVAAYGSGVWAYMALLILHRGFYAMDDRMTPMKIGFVIFGTNIILNFTLLYLLGDVGLPLSTAFSATFQMILVSLFLQKRTGSIPKKELAMTLLKALFASIFMGFACWFAMKNLPASEGMLSRAVSVLVPIGIGVAVYLILAKLLKMDDIFLLLSSKKKK